MEALRLTTANTITNTSKVNDFRESYQFVKQQKPITFSLELKLTARIFSNFFFSSLKSKIVIS